MAISGTQGTVNFIDSKPLLTGSFSGLDTAALIEASLFARRQPAVLLENKITENDTKIAAYTEFSGLLSTLQSSLNAFRSPPGFTGLTDNLFEQKSVFLSSSDSAVAPTDILGATADNTADPGTYTVVVDQIATAHKVAGTTIADSTAALGVTETLTINLAGAAAEEIATIDVTATQSASDVVNAINNASDTTGVRASLVQVSASDYRVILTAEESNKDIEITGDNAGATLSALGLSADNGATFNDVLETSQPALITFDGLGTQIQRDSNELDDVLSGVTIDLFKADPGTTITIEVEPDLAAIRSQFDAFVTAYNDVKLFIQSQQEVSGDGEVADTAVLFGDSILRQAGTDLGDGLTGFVNGLDSGVFTTLRDIGIELDSNALLTIDSGTLDAALVSNLDQVRSVLEFGFTSSSADYSVVGRENVLDIGSFDITVPAGAIDGTNLQVAGVDAFAVDGNILRGIDGTAYEGLVLGTSRDTSDAAALAETVSISTTLGIAEILYQEIDANISINGGVITDQVSQLQDQIADYNQQIAAIDERLAIFQQSLIEKYSRLEQSLAEADAVANQLQAFLNSGRDN